MIILKRMAGTIGAFRVLLAGTDDNEVGQSKTCKLLALDLVSKHKVTKILNICFLGNRRSCSELAIFQNCLVMNNGKSVIILKGQKAVLNVT